MYQTTRPSWDDFNSSLPILVTKLWAEKPLIPLIIGGKWTSPFVSQETSGASQTLHCVEKRTETALIRRT
jgi:hypothetical protein